MSRGIEYIISVIDRATAPLRKVVDSIGGVGKKFKTEQKEIDSGMNNVANSAKGLAAAIGLAFSISAIAAFGRELVDVTSKFEKYDAVLTTQYLGNERAAKQAYDKVVNFADAASLPVDGMIESFQKLKSQGFDPTTAELFKLSDIVSSTGKPFDQLAEAILDAQTGEFERLKEFGIKASAEGDKVAFNFRGLSTVVAKTAEAMRGYLLNLGNMDGVAGATERIAKTIGGGLQRISNQWLLFKRDLGDSLAPLVGELSAKIASLMNRLKPVGQWLKEHPTFVRMLATAIGIVTAALALFAVGMWAVNAALWANPITWVVAAIVALSLAIAWVITYTEGWGKSFTALGKIVMAIKDIIVVSFQQAWANVRYGVDMVWLKTKSFFQWIGQAVVQTMNALNKLKSFDFSGAYSEISKEIKTSASVEITNREDSYNAELATNVKTVAGKLNDISTAWKDVGISVKSDSKKTVAQKAAEAVGVDNSQSQNKEANKAAAAGKPGKGTGKGISDGGSRPTTYNITIHKLQDKIEIHATTTSEGGKRAADEVANELVEALMSLDGKQ